MPKRALATTYTSVAARSSRVWFANERMVLNYLVGYLNSKMEITRLHFISLK